MKKIMMAMAFSLALVGAAGCSSGSGSANSADEYTTAQQQQFFNGFVNSPSVQNLPKEQVQAVGECVWRGIQSQISYSDFAAYDQNSNSPDTQGTATKVQQITQECQSNTSAF